MTVRTATPTAPSTSTHQPLAPPSTQAAPSTRAAALDKGYPVADRMEARQAPAPANQKVAELRALIAGDIDRPEEAKILTLVRGATPAELDLMMKSVDVTKLVHGMEDHWLSLKSTFAFIQFGPKSRSDLVRLLSEGRLADLSPESRAHVVRALQVGFTDRREEKAIKNIFVNTRGRDLTALKNGLEVSGNYHDLQRLVFHDIDNKGIRNEILQHIAREGAALPPSAVKILSDIDDTFYANLKDKGFPKKTVYPGIRQLYQELDRGTNDDRRGDLVFITARPGLVGGVVEDATIKMLKANQVDATVLTGNLISNVSNNEIAKEKLQNFSDYRQLYPEYNVVFFGDDGQGDVQVAKGIRDAAAQASRLALIHDVVGMSAAERQRLRDETGAVVFDSYVDAGTEAYTRGLIGRDGLLRVMDAAQAEFAAITFESEAQKGARAAELQSALERAAAALAPRS